MRSRAGHRVGPGQTRDSCGDADQQPTAGRVEEVVSHG